MATWTGAAPAEAADLFAVTYRRLWSMRQSEITDALDVAAFFYVRTGGLFSGSQRTLAVVHMAAHLLESAPPDGTNLRAGGPIAARNNERGSQSYTTVQPGTFFGVDAYLLQGTEGGRALLAMKVRHPSTAAYI